MRIRVDSCSQAEYVSAIIIGNWLWRSRWPGFNPDDIAGSVPQPPMVMVQRLGYSYIGMLSAENNKTFDEIYTALLNGPLGKDLVDNLKLTSVQKIAYVADRIASAATQEPVAIDPWYFGDLRIPLVEPYVDLVSTPDVVA